MLEKLPTARVHKTAGRKSGRGIDDDERGYRRGRLGIRFTKEFTEIGEENVAKGRMRGGEGIGGGWISQDEGG